ncbi:MAG: hypothetical protein E7233_02465 [Lachnospiraceae bacterium]|nr:hypothetical protein [Lachnospiraceae bacterium]
MKEKTVLLDGASGTLLWEFAEEAGLPKKPVWQYNTDHPELVTKLAKSYIEAGSDIIFANTFSINSLSLEHASGYDLEESVRSGVRLAKEAAAGTGTKVALDIGPLSVFMEPYGDLEEDEAADIYREILDAGTKENPDLIVLETFMDLNMLEVAAQTAKEYGIPVICSMSFDKNGRTMMGNSVSDIAERLAPLSPAAIGLNCSLGPEEALPIIREFASVTDLPLFFKPNTGPTLADGSSRVAAEEYVKDVSQALDIVTYIGGCCGTSPEYIRLLADVIKNS